MPECFLSHHAGHIEANSNSVSPLAESSPMDHKCQHESENTADGCIKMQTDDEVVADGSHSGDINGSALRHPSIVESSDLARTISSNASLAEQVIEPALVMFEVHVPPICMLDGVHSQHFFGTGVIIHHSDSLGLVAVDRNTVAVSISDIMLCFAAYPIQIPAEVVFLHPVHNFALVAYDPSALGAGASVIRAAKLLPEPALRRGDSVYLVGLSRSLQATSRKSTITNPCTAVNIGSADCPRYRAINMEVIELDTDFGSSFLGILTNEQGRVQALWASFSTQIFKWGTLPPQKIPKHSSASVVIMGGRQRRSLNGVCSLVEDSSAFFCFRICSINGSKTNKSRDWMSTMV